MVSPREPTGSHRRAVTSLTRRARSVLPAGSTYPRDRFLEVRSEAVRRALPPELRRFQLRKRWSLIQLSYGLPRLHYEIWLRTTADLIELGLHLEADATTNARVLDQIADHALEVREALGPACDLEVWTSTWGRVHTVLPLTPLDDQRLETCVAWIARCIVTLQPLVEAALGRHGRLDERGRDHMREALAGGGVIAAADDDTDQPALSVEEGTTRIPAAR